MITFVGRSTYNKIITFFMITFLERSSNNDAIITFVMLTFLEHSINNTKIMFLC